MSLFVAVVVAAALAPAASAEPKIVYDSFCVGGAGTQGGQCNTPRGTAVNSSGAGNADAGDVFVVDGANHRIQQFDARGKFIRAWGADVALPAGGTTMETCTVAANCKIGVTTTQVGGAFNQPQGVAVDQSDGAIYVTDQGNRRVQKFTLPADLGDPVVFDRAWGADVTLPAGGTAFEVCTVAADCKIAAAAGALGGQFAAAIGHPAVNPVNGNVLVADSTNRRVQEFTSAGGFVRVFGADVNAPAGGTDFEICTVPADCKVAAAAGTGLGQFGNNTPTRMAVDSAGGIYAVEPTTPNFRVQKFTPSGPSLVASVFAAPLLSGTSSAGATQNNPSEIAIDEDDNVFVVKACNATDCPGANPANERRILEVGPAGALRETHLAGAGIGATIAGLGMNATSGWLYMSTSQSTPITSFSVAIITDPPGTAPVVTTGAAGPGQASHLRTLEGTVNPDGFKVSDCYFEYGATTSYGQRTPCVPEPGDGTDDVAVSASTAPLEPSTTYHYRLVAANAGQTGLGVDRTFTTSPAPPDGCPNAGIRLAQGIAALLLPDCMALEMVSPPIKLNQYARVPDVSVDGGRVRFYSQAALADTPARTRIDGDPYVATRDSAGWQTAAVEGPTGFLKSFTATRMYSPGFDRWAHLTRTAIQQQAGIVQAFSAGLGGLHEPLSPLIDQGSGALAQIQGAGASADLSQFYFSSVASAVGGPAMSLLPGDPVLADPSAGAASNIYVAQLDSSGEPSLELLARDGEGKVWGGNCGVRLGGDALAFDTGSSEQNRAVRKQGAVSRDGSRVYFSTRPTQPATARKCDRASNKLRVLRRLSTSEGPWISTLAGQPSGECDRVPAPPEVPACGTSGPDQTPVPDGDDIFQGASVDGTKVYFVTTRQLADSDLDSGTECNSTIGQSAGCDLYLYDTTRPSGQRLTQVSAGDDTNPTPGSGARVLASISGISGDGTRVYFVAQGVLTTVPGPAGGAAVAGQPNLYSWEADSGETAFIGTLAAGDRATAAPSGGLWHSVAPFNSSAYPVPIAGKDGQGNEVGGDGRVFFFRSRAALTADDSDGSQVDLFRYDSETHQLERVSKGDDSCQPGCDNGPFNLRNSPAGSVGPDFAEAGRFASEDGDTAVFLTGEALVPEDNNDALDSYLWRNGRLFLLPGSLDRVQPATSLSHDGDMVAFSSTSQLLAQDRDSATDVYVARVGGGFEPPAEPVACDLLADRCQSGGAVSVPVTSRSEQPGGGNASAGPRRTLAIGRVGPGMRRRAARTGVVRLRVRTSAAGRVTAVARARVRTRGGKGRVRRVARGVVRAKGAGRVVVALRLNRVARGHLRSGRALRLQVGVHMPGARARSMTLRLERASS